MKFITVNIGDKFGRLTVINSLPTHKKHIKYKCLCECGNETSTRKSHLISNEVRSCGCLKDDVLAEQSIKFTKHKLIIGAKYNRLTVIKTTGRDKDGKIQVKCICDCGNEIITTFRNLPKQHTKSCGCFKLDKIQDRAKLHWENIDPWQHEYSNFLSRTKSRKLTSNITLIEFTALCQNNCIYCLDPPNTKTEANILRNGIDRIDNDIGYILNNCVTCCSNCNRMKEKRTKDDFLNRIKKIYQQLNK